MAEPDQDDGPALVAAVAAGDEAAFSVLYRRYLPLVVRYCLRETRDRELAADLSAEVFAAALTAARRYRAAGGPVGPWLLGIARNKVRESRRRGRVESSARRRLRVEPLALTDADLERVDELAGADEQVAALVHELPSPLRDALTERVVAERPYSEIAAELRCSEAVVRQRVSRALRTLRSQLEDR